jgi:N-acetylglucosaminyldiphosphoundecaprenol N-acetyl-beta-D-mannosaminyltransferase
VKSLKILGVRIDDVSRREVAGSFANFLNRKSFNHIATVNPEFLVEAEKNKKFRGILNKTSLNICDGVGISIISRVLHRQRVNRITGVEVAEILCRICEKEGKSIYLLGGFDVAEVVAKKLREKFPKLKIVGFEDGNPAKISDKLLKAKPDAILVAFGAPKQEIWLDKFARKIPSLRIGIGIGGTFDFWSGRAKRAPWLVRTIGLEWFWRLVLEPRIRGKRIFRAVFVFPYLVIIDFFKK